MALSHATEQDYAAFFRTVQRMRAAQKAYFKDKRLSDLDESRKIEREVDRHIAKMLAPSDERPGLFGESQEMPD